MGKMLKKYTFAGLGFPVLLHDVAVKETEDGEEYPDINMKELEQAVAKALIKGQVPLNGAKLKFLRKLLKLSLRELGQELGVPHTNIKLWEDNAKDKTGLEAAQEKQLKYLVLIHIQVLEQKELSKTFFADIQDSSAINAPIEIEYKYGA
ncbi:MAG: hypothetical protein HYV97_19120 [Bdellovibrio sp.]|nr:hypothetical protein [Bdellovibrio sp.]